MVYNRIMHKDHDNFIVDNIFTNQEIDEIYNYINNTPEEHKLLINHLGQVAYQVGLPEHILIQVEKIMNSVLQYPVKLANASFATYSNEAGYSPKLFPHYDAAFDEPRITLDIQLKSNFNWDLFVEGKKFSLKDNQALVFSGTNQIHWRENQKILDGQKLDMIFCHFSSTKYPTFENNWKETMESRQLMWRDKVAIIIEEKKI